MMFQFGSNASVAALPVPFWGAPCPFRRQAGAPFDAVFAQAARERLAAEALGPPTPTPDAVAAPRVLIDQGGALSRLIERDAAAPPRSTHVALARGRGWRAARLAAEAGLTPLGAFAEALPATVERVRVAAPGSASAALALAGFAVETVDGAALGLEPALGALVLRDPWTGARLDLDAALDARRFLLDAAGRAPRVVVTVGLSAWKRRNVAPFLSGAAGPARHRRRLGAALRLVDTLGGDVALWGPSRARADALRAAGRAPLLLEDGFLRSAGLGVEHERPISLVVARSALHFETDRATDFREIAAAVAEDAALTARGAALAATVRAAKLAKYAQKPGAARPPEPPTGRAKILVVGQVEGDASLRFGGGYPRGNLELLERVRERRPTAFLVYKPHPDVVAGLRRDAAYGPAGRAVADHIADDVDPAAALDWADAVETMTSQLGFEALMRGKPVTCHGRPFYAGFGLTEDLPPDASPKTALKTPLTLDALVAAALLAYPLYVAPGSRTPCPPERAVEALLALRDGRRGLVGRVWRKAASRALNIAARR